MDARRNGPIAGTVAMFATIWFIVASPLLAQYGPVYGPAQYGPAPIVYGQPIMASGYGQAIPQGIILGAIGNQGRPMLGRPRSTRIERGQSQRPSFDGSALADDTSRCAV